MSASTETIPTPTTTLYQPVTKAAPTFYQLALQLVEEYGQEWYKVFMLQASAWAEEEKIAGLEADQAFFGGVQQFYEAFHGLSEAQKAHLHSVSKDGKTGEDHLDKLFALKAELDQKIQAEPTRYYSKWFRENLLGERVTKASVSRHDPDFQKNLEAALTKQGLSLHDANGDPLSISMGHLPETAKINKIVAYQRHPNARQPEVTGYNFVALLDETTSGQLETFRVPQKMQSSPDPVKYHINLEVKPHVAKWLVETPGVAEAVFGQSLSFQDSGMKERNGLPIEMADVKTSCGYDVELDEVQAILTLTVPSSIQNGNLASLKATSPALEAYHNDMFEKAKTHAKATTGGQELDGLMAGLENPVKAKGFSFDYHLTLCNGDRGAHAGVRAFLASKLKKDADFFVNAVKSVLNQDASEHKAKAKA